MGTLDRPSTGTVRVTGLDVATLTDRELAALRATRIGFVFQQFFLAEHASALENVADGLFYAGVRHRRAAPSGPRGADQGGARASDARPARPSSREASANGSPSPGPWSDAPPSCWPTSRPGTSTAPPAQAILTLLEELNAAGATIVVITHDRAIAGRLPRQVEMLDGRIVADTRPVGLAPEGTGHR